MSGCEEVCIIYQGIRQWYRHFMRLDVITHQPKFIPIDKTSVYYGIQDTARNLQQVSDSDFLQKFSNISLDVSVSRYLTRTGSNHGTETTIWTCSFTPNDSVWDSLKIFPTVYTYSQYTVDIIKICLPNTNVVEVKKLGYMTNNTPPTSCFVPHDVYYCAKARAFHILDFLLKNVANPTSNKLCEKNYCQ